MVFESTLWDISHTDVANIYSILNCLFAMNWNPVLCVLQVIQSNFLRVVFLTGPGGEGIIPNQSKIYAQEAFVIDNLVTTKGGQFLREKNNPYVQKGWTNKSPSNHMNVYDNILLILYFLSIISKLGRLKDPIWLTFQ